MISILSQRSLKYSMRNFLKRRSPATLPARTEYYFAYGANLSASRFEKNHLNFEIVGNARAPGFQIEFSMPCEYKEKGYGSLSSNEDAEAWGVLFKVDRLSMWMLDILEWVPFGAYRRERISVECNGQMVKDVWVYIADNPRKGLKAPKGYRDAIVKEAVRLGFPQSYIDSVLAHEVAEQFDLDPGFSLLFQKLRRPLEQKLKHLYLFHDRIREKLAEKLP